MEFTIKKTNVTYKPIPTKKQNNIIKSIKKRIRIPTQPNTKQTHFKAFLKAPIFKII